MTGIICKGYQKNNDSIKYIELSKNRGTNAARNAAIKISTGNFIIFLDSDDYFVENALSIIDNTIKLHPDYKHYMFAPNDVCYEKSPLNEYETKELKFIDFLNGSINTGFIHCIDALVIKSHLFDEDVRIHESVFFLSFYKEEQRMLFSNKIVTIRERMRADSVTYDTIRLKKVIIERIVRADEIMLERFGNDMKDNNCYKQLNKLYMNLLENYLLLENYSNIAKLKRLYNYKYQMLPARSFKLVLYEIICRFKLGIIYRILLQCYLYTKYKVLKKKMN